MGELNKKLVLTVTCEGTDQQTVIGRDAWALQQLMSAGNSGCTSLNNPAPRWSHYVWKLRQAGINVETVTEPHSGQFAGTHARYILRSTVTVVAESQAA